MATVSKTASNVQTAADTRAVDEINESVVDREVGAAFIAAGIGSLILGILIAITEMKAGAGIKSALAFVSSVGPLSGKTTVSVIGFFLSWVILHFVLRNRPLKLTTSFVITVVLVVLGLALSFPPVFEIFAR